MSDITHCVIGSGAIGLTLTGMFCHISRPRLVGRHSAPDQFRISRNSVAINYLSPKTFYAETWDTIKGSKSPRCFWVTVKAYDLENACKLLSPILSAQDCVALCQNGFDIQAFARQILGDNIPTIRALLHFGAFKHAHNQVEQFGPIQLTLASQESDLQALNSVKNELERASALVSIAANIRTAEWNKAAINLVVNSICTIARVPNRELITDPNLSMRAQRMLSEITQVASASGIALTDTWEKFAQRVATFGENRNSTLIDLERGRELEIGSMLAQFLARAKESNIDVPESQSIFKELKL